MTAATSYRLRYTRWQDRLLAFLWPPKRKHLRMAQAVLDSSMDEIRREADPIQRDLLLYGTAFVRPDGTRIDPRTVRVYDH